MYFMQTVAMEESMMHLSERSLNVIIESHKRYTIDTQSMHKPLKVDSENVTSKPSNCVSYKFSPLVVTRGRFH
jgi:hypothetical protein